MKIKSKKDKLSRFKLEEQLKKEKKSQKRLNDDIQELKITHDFLERKFKAARTMADLILGRD